MVDAPGPSKTQNSNLTGTFLKSLGLTVPVGIALAVLPFMFNANPYRSQRGLISDGIVNGTLIPQLRLLTTDGEEHVFELNNPSAEDIASAKGLADRMAKIGNVIVEILDVHKNLICKVSIPPYDLTMLARGYDTNPEAFESAQSYEDLAKVCGIPPEGIKTLYLNKNFSLESLPYDLKGGAKNDARYAEGYAKRMAEEKAAGDKIKKS